MRKNLLWSTRPLTFQATVAICNTGVFRTKFISVIITDPAKSYCAPSALCWRFQSKRVIRSRVRSEFPRKMEVVLFVGEKIILFGYHSFSATMWQNFASESGLSNVPQILPFLWFSLLHFLTFLFPLVHCNTTSLLSVWAKHANKMRHY